jgi:fumarate reductase flavoprotein subunit
MIKKKIPTTNSIEKDVAIVGAGGAGLTAAIAASERGSRVIVVEKRSPGGSSAMAKGFLAAESPVQKRALIHTPRDLVYQIAMRYSHLKINPRIIRAFVDKSGNTAEWLEKMGVVIERVSPSFIDQYPLTWHVLKGGGAHLIDILEKTCLERGVQIISQTEGKEILKNRNGDLTGLLVAKSDKQMTISAKSVILATGGYGGNAKLLKKYCPFYYEGMLHIGAPNMGDGLSMATLFGAATDGLGVMHLAGPYFSEKVSMNINNQNIVMPLAAIGFEPNILWVNKHGERFIDESEGGDHFECAYAVARQPDRVAYMIIDSGIVWEMERNGLIAGQGKHKELQRMGMPGLADVLKSVGGKGKVLVSDSWDKVAQWIGAESHVLKKTIEDYNTCCDRGFDPVFAKERRFLIPISKPPFYVMKGVLSFLGTIGGIKINQHMQVINKQDRPIPGLYAAGVDTGGWTADNYCGKLPGTTFGFALNSGRIAGENAAVFSLEKRSN